jgi:hypothetical protein
MSRTNVPRLRELGLAVANQDFSSFSMRVPAEPDRDADLVLTTAACEIDFLRSENAALRGDVAMLMKYDAAVWSSIVWAMPEISRLRGEVDACLAEMAKEVMHRLATEARLRAILNTFPWLLSVVPADRLLSGGGAL